MTKEIITIQPIVFKIVWPILYTLLLLFILFTYTQPKTKTRTIIIWTFWTSIALNILWIFLYWKLKKPFLAILDLIAMIITALYILYLSFPDKSSNKKSIFNFIVFVLYSLWLCFALILTILNKKYVDNKKL